MDDWLSSQPPYPSGPELPPVRVGCARVLSRGLCGLGGAVLGFFGGAVGCVRLCPGDGFNPDGTALDALAMVALLVGVAGAAFGGWVGARLG